MNRKGFMRVVEATVAVLIILGAMLLLSTQRTPTPDVDLGKNIPQLLDEIANNFTMRQQILDSTPENENATESQLESYLENKINPSANYKLEICEFLSPCYIDPYPNTENAIFASERVISATIDETVFSPKKIKIFVWLKDSR